MTTRRGILALGFGAIIAPLLGPRVAWARDWVDLGSRKVSVFGEADRIMVADDGGIYSKLRIKVAGNGVHVERAIVHFGNGDETTYEVDIFVQKNTVSGAVNLPGDGRVILYVDMFYRRRKNGNGVAVVTLQGLKV